MMRFAVLGWLLIAASVPAHAYMGPLMSLGAIGAALGVAGTFILGILGVVFYPLKRLYRRIRGISDEDVPPPAPPRAE
jgi:hypothetical protein